MRWNQFGRPVHLTLDVRHEASDFSVWDSMSFCRKTRHSTHVRAFHWTTIAYTRKELLVFPRLCMAGASIAGLADSYRAYDNKTTVSTSPQTVLLSRHPPLLLPSERKNAGTKKITVRMNRRYVHILHALEYIPRNREARPCPLR